MKPFRSPAQGCDKKLNPKDFSRIGALIGNLLDKATYEIFVHHRDVLLRKPITYIVPAIWGVNEGSPLDSLQKEIHERISPVVDEVVESLELQGLDLAQEFALHYLVRGYIVLRVVYMIEAYRGLTTAGGVVEQKRRPDILNHLQPLGRA
jgi:hypothetical protein